MRVNGWEGLLLAAVTLTLTLVVFAVFGVELTHLLQSVEHAFSSQGH